MDIQLNPQPLRSTGSLLIRTAVESFLAWFFIAVITTAGVHSLTRLAHMPSGTSEIAEEQLRWILPIFTYIWAMFYMIERARQCGAGVSTDLQSQHRGRSLLG